MPMVSLPLLIFALAAIGCTEANPLGVAADVEVADDVDSFIELVNTHRARIGCEALGWSNEVAAVAQRHSEDMVQRNYFNHVNPDGDSPFDRLSAANISYMRAAENIAAGQRTAEEVLAAWLNSDGHRRNIENCAFTHHGLGLDARHWTHVFVTPF